MSNFDPNAFLDATITEPSTKRTPIPAGLDVIGTIEKVESRSWQGKADPTKSGIALDISIKLDLTTSPAAHSAVGQDSVILNDSIMLDLTEGGMINNAPGKNSKLRRYREALDMNKAGDAFSPRMMVGRNLRAKIKHEPYEGEMYDKIDSVAKV